jgi:multidrug efflux system outer membrane protein
MYKSVSTTSALALALALSGCAMLQDSATHPQANPAAAWRVAAPAGDVEALLAKDFWTAFDEPVLDRLMEEALRANPDVRIAAANVELYRARLSAVDADRFPQVFGNAQGARGKGGSFSQTPTNSFSLGIDLSWEIDLWGRLARASDAARAELLAQTEVQRGVYLSLASVVAQGYFTLRRLDAQLATAQSTLALRATSLKLFTLRFKGGVVSEVELAQVRSEYELAAVAVPQIESDIARTENALSALLGRNPGPIDRGRELEAVQDPQVPAGLPSQLIARRPDILAAEAQLAAADARVDVARRAYFPRISLTGLLGVASDELAELFDGDTQEWYVAGGLTQPIFDAGRIGAGVVGAEAERAALIAQYQKTVQGAFREVDDALVARVKLREQLAAAQRQVDALRRYAELARLRYEGGYTSYLEVVDAERTLFAAELNRIALQNEALRATVTLYAALGGSWMDEHIAAQMLPGQPQ